MTKHKFLILLVVGLIISNILLLIMMKRDGRRDGGPKDIIIEKLHFDPEQVKLYEQSIKLHRRAIRENEDRMNALRTELYNQLKYEQNSAVVDSIIAEIGQEQMEAEKINYNHFLEIKKLCKPSQMEDYNAFTDEIVHLFSPKKRK